MRDVSRPRVSSPVEAPLGRQREDVPEDLRDLPGRPELGGEVRAVAHDAEGVRLAGAYRDFLSGANEPRTAKALPDAERSLVYEKPLLLLEVTVQGAAVSVTSRVDVSLEEVAVRVEDVRAEAERRACEDVPGCDGWCGRALARAGGRRAPGLLAARGGRALAAAGLRPLAAARTPPAGDSHQLV